jgi:large subunit ribosomal protein L4
MAESLTVPVLTQSKEPSGEMTLPAGVFDGPVRRHLLYEVVKMQQANRRAGTAATKTRGFVSGGGKKPWRQKGTGRARAGSSRSPVWVGGATIFGPQPRSYAYRLPSSARRAALRAALALKVKEGKLIVLDQIVVEPMKTKVFAQMVADLGLTSALFIVPSAHEGLERAARNLPRVKVLRAAGANVYDILRYQHLVLTREAVDALSARVTT